jgi:hypothetical protein
MPCTNGDGVRATSDADAHAVRDKSTSLDQRASLAWTVQVLEEVDKESAAFSNIEYKWAFLSSYLHHQLSLMAKSK